MTEEQFNEILDKLDKQSSYFHEDTCSATYSTNGESIYDIINFRDADTGSHIQFNIGDAAYIFDSFLDIDKDENVAIDFFNKFIEYRGLKIVKV